MFLVIGEEFEIFCCCGNKFNFFGVELILFDCLGMYSGKGWTWLPKVSDYVFRTT